MVYLSARQLIVLGLELVLELGAATGSHKLEDEDEHEAVARMSIDNYFSKFATKRPNGAFCNIFGGYRHSAPDYFRLRFKSPGHGFTVDQDQKAPNI
jgi:hypothetical protein